MEALQQLRELLRQRHQQLKGVLVVEASCVGCNGK
jgi:hypothetical protein